MKKKLAMLSMLVIMGSFISACDLSDTVLNSENEPSMTEPIQTTISSTKLLQETTTATTETEKLTTTIVHTTTEFSETEVTQTEVEETTAVTSTSATTTFTVVLTEKVAETTTETIIEATEAPTTEAQHDYVLNTNTMKFHKPGCYVINKIKPENYAECTATRNEVLNMGYEPCAKCYP